MTTITAPIIGIVDNTISVSVETDLNADARMTNSNVMITQDDSMAASTGGLLLSQDTISSVDFVDSQQHETTDLAAAVTAIKQQPLLPPPLLVQCPNVSDVLFPMEGFKMWPANVYCEIILQQYEAKCIAIGDIQERQAKLVQDIIHLIRSQQNANDNMNVVKCGGRFLKAIQVPYRMHKLNQQHESNDQPTEDYNSNNTVNGDVTSSKTIWEVMHEADAMKVLSKILLARCTKTSQEDNTNDQNESIPPRHNERSSQIAASSLAILQGLYYVPNYYPSRTERRPHEYDSHGSDDDESYASLSDNDDDDDDEENEQETIRIKKRRLIHCSTDDFKCKNPSETSNQRPKGKRPTSANKKSSCPPHSKVSMIGRVLVNNDGDERCSAHQVSSAEDPIHHSSTIDLHQHNNYTKASFHFFKPQKSMKSQQAMIEQEGSDDLPKGVTVRPSGKWQAQTYFAGQSRYVGVYATSRLAARAYNVVQEYLHSYRTEHKITKDTPKDELHAVFNEARRIAHEAVQILRRDLRIKEGICDDEGEDVTDFPIDEPKMDDQVQQNLQLRNDPPLEEVSAMAEEDESTESDGVVDPPDTTSASQVEDSRQLHEMKAEKETSVLSNES